MGFVSFAGRVLFASVFLLSAYQEYVCLLVIASPSISLSLLSSTLPCGYGSHCRRVWIAGFGLGSVSVDLVWWPRNLRGLVGVWNVELSLSLRCLDLAVGLVAGWFV